MTTNPSVCLVMIVRDESAVIGRCIRSVRGVCDEAVIVDTGSKDDTMAKARAAWGRGGFHPRRADWVDFATNRTQALRLAAGIASCDFFFTIDADEVLYNPPGQRLAFDGSKDLYEIDVDYCGLRYARACVMHHGLEWRYHWPVHEVLTVPDGATRGGTIPGCVIVPSPDGARSKDPRKYQKDAALLYAWLEKHPDDTRAAYYYAQSLRDAGLLVDARAAYSHRAGMHWGWDEETWSAALEAVKCRERLFLRDKASLDSKQREVEISGILDSYIATFHLRPSRAEPLYHAIRFCNENGYGAIAQAMRPAWERVRLPTSDRLFVETWAYAPEPQTK